MNPSNPSDNDTQHTSGAAPHAAKSIWFENNGARLFAVDGGSGRLIIALPGALANHLAALHFVGTLASRFRLVTPDLRGSGKSVYAGPLTWDELADDVDALMRHLGCERAVIVGFSFGSGVALRFALRHPERVAGLVLVMPVYAGEEQGLTEHQKAAFEMMDALGSRAVAEGVQVLYPLYQGLPSPMREHAMAMADGFDAASVAASTRFVASGAQPFTTASDLRALGVPTLIVPGSDALHPPEVAALYASQIPRCTMREPPSGDVASIVGEFCDGLDW